VWQFWPFQRRPRQTDTLNSIHAPRRRIFGREYTAGVPYALPSDLDEMNRLDFQHYVLRQAFKGNYAAPIRNPSSILDVGTGTGRWAKEMAALFPTANVIGLDIKEPVSDEQSAVATIPDLVPANYSFASGNILEGLPFPDGTFDFVHQRLLFFAIPDDRWQFVLNELYRVTRPGGWVEVVEGRYGYEPMGPAAQHISDVMLIAMQKRGIDPRNSANLAQYLRAAGFQHVHTRAIKLPVGDWGGRLGQLAKTDVLTFSQAAKPLLRAQGMTESECAQLIDTMRRECEQLHYTWPFYIVYGQRPG
jgi:ubiquinone/menaquinone biosynthesis C-methylase UbiE